MVRFARNHGIKPAARCFATTPKTVRKWLRRWQPGTLKGLEELSRSPKKPFRRIPTAQRNLAITFKKQCPSWGAERIKCIFGLTISDKAMRGIWHKEGLLKKNRRKHKTKNDLREIKASWKLFEQLCMDTKDLIDIPELWPQLRLHNLPKVQYTAREILSGTQFIAYAQERSLTYSTLFAEIIITHLQKCSVNLKGCRIQMDNGSEFIGNWQAKEDSAFTKAVQSVPSLTLGYRTTIPVK